MFGQVLDEVWKAYNGPEKTKPVIDKARDVDSGKQFLECKELCLNSSGELVHVDRPPCLNKVNLSSTVAFYLTPYFSSGSNLMPLIF